MAGIIVRGQELEGPAGLTIQNFRMAGLPSLRNAARRGGVTEVVVHETVTQSARATVDILQRRGLGVHFVVGYDGLVYQHADLLDDECWHATEHNAASVGIETVNPLETRYLPAVNPPWENTIEVPWTNNNPYVVPTPEQSESVCLLLDWLSSPGSTLSIPRTWRGLEGQSLHMNHMPVSQMGPGIYAHRYFSKDHPDGSWLVLYAWLRLEAGLDPRAAYDESLRRAPGKSQIELGDYFVRQQPEPSV